MSRSPRFRLTHPRRRGRTGCSMDLLRGCRVSAQRRLGHRASMGTRTVIQDPGAGVGVAVGDELPPVVPGLIGPSSRKAPKVSAAAARTAKLSSAAPRERPRGRQVLCAESFGSTEAGYRCHAAGARRSGARSGSGRAWTGVMPPYPTAPAFRLGSSPFDRLTRTRGLAPGVAAGRDRAAPPRAPRASTGRPAPLRVPFPRRFRSRRPAAHRDPLRLPPAPPWRTPSCRGRRASRGCRRRPLSSSV